MIWRWPRKPEKPGFTNGPVSLHNNLQKKRSRLFTGLGVDRQSVTGARARAYCIPDGLMNAAKNLDSHYIPSRYPDGMAEGTPSDHFNTEDANDAIRCARDIVRFCQNILT